MAAGYPGQPLALLRSAGFGVMAVIAALAVWRGTWSCQRAMAERRPAD